MKDCEEFKYQPAVPWKMPPAKFFESPYCECGFPGSMGIDILVLVLSTIWFSDNVSLKKTSYMFILPSKPWPLFCYPTHLFTSEKYIKYFPYFLFYINKWAFNKLNKNKISGCYPVLQKRQIAFRRQKTKSQYLHWLVYGMGKTKANRKEKHKPHNNERPTSKKKKKVHLCLLRCLLWITLAEGRFEGSLDPTKSQRALWGEEALSPWDMEKCLQRILTSVNQKKVRPIGDW